jgi:hypothetical protein
MTSIANTQLVEFVYPSLFMDVPPVKVIGQVVGTKGAIYVWVDGLDAEDPILVRLVDAPALRHLGTLAAYVRANESAFAEAAESASTRGIEVTPLLIVRAVEAAKADKQGLAVALDVTLRWARMLLELDEIERQAFERAFAAAAGASRSQN